ncbi:MAG: hypothetical protein J0I09_13995 [Sphingobacteriia bacterium]|nr:hypothetical protein [Sphingobacteriia bacterium]
MQVPFVYKFLKGLEVIFNKVCYTIASKKSSSKNKRLTGTFSQVNNSSKYISFKHDTKRNDITIEPNEAYTQENLALLSQYLANEEIEQAKKTYRSKLSITSNTNLQGLTTLKEILQREINRL